MTTGMTDTQNTVETLEWYHPNTTRHIAESILMQNGKDGTYLMRPSSKEGEFALSVRAKDAVQHFEITWSDDKFHFGLNSFASFDEFLVHFENQPLLGGETGVLTVLKHPYPREVDEPNVYETIKVHGEFGSKKVTPADRPHFQLASKEGYLTKQGGFVKNWKVRWFVLLKNELKYFRDRNDETPAKTLELHKCQGVDLEDIKGKDFCFKLIFPWRTFYICASSESERDEWMKLILWKLNSLATD